MKICRRLILLLVAELAIVGITTAASDVNVSPKTTPNNERIFLLGEFNAALAATTSNRSGSGSAASVENNPAISHRRRRRRPRTRSRTVQVFLRSACACTTYENAYVIPAYPRFYLRVCFNVREKRFGPWQRDARSGLHRAQAKPEFHPVEA